MEYVYYPVYLLTLPDDFPASTDLGRGWQLQKIDETAYDLFKREPHIYFDCALVKEKPDLYDSYDMKNVKQHIEIVGSLHPFPLTLILNLYFYRPVFTLNGFIFDDKSKRFRIIENLGLPSYGGAKLFLSCADEFWNVVYKSCPKEIVEDIDCTNSCAEIMMILKSNGLFVGNTILSEEIYNFQEFIKEITDALSIYVNMGASNDDIVEAIDRYGKTFIPPYNRDTLVNEFAALEALYTRPNEAKEGMSYKLQQRMSLLIGLDNKEKAKIFEILKELYTIRSKHVHGSRTKDAYDDSASYKYHNEMHDILRRSILAFLSIRQICKTKKQKDEVISMLDNKYDAAVEKIINQSEKYIKLAQHSNI